MRACILSLSLSLCAALWLCSAVAAAESAVTIPNPIADAKAGEWVLMEDVSGAESGEALKVTLIAVDDENFTIRTERINADGNTAGTNDSTVSREDYAGRIELAAERAAEITEEFVFIGEKEYPVVAVRFDAARPGDGDGDGESGERGEVKIWISPDLPVTGIAKTWTSNAGFPSYEVVDFGF